MLNNSFPFTGSPEPVAGAAAAAAGAAAATASCAETPTAKSEEKIVFELVEDTVAPVQTPVAPVTTPTINQEELVVMSEFIKNLDVTFEIVSPITDIDFKISTPAAETVQEVKPVQQRTFEREEQTQTTFSFDLPFYCSRSFYHLRCFSIA